MLRSKSSPVSYVFKYRDRTTIMTDILDTVRNSRGGKKKTRIMQSARLNHVQTEKYLNYLVGCGYLVGTDKKTYVITKGGSRFLQLIEMQKVGMSTLR
ncbi:MAG: winged helix-turn-helix domain-containing protein [Candidatus Bathyarchaeota archaeon]|nr:winged helix-turn-helix domain-containing protein [Candidatus Bathyarchaeota archaeon]